MSPDGKLIFFKLSAASDDYKPQPEGHLKWPRSYQSAREGLVCFDIEHSRLLFFRRDWGHPAWHPSSKSFINVPNVMIDALTGKEQWAKRLGGNYSASPIVVDGRIYFSNQEGQTVVIKPAATFEQLALNKLDDGCMASPAVVGKAIILRTKTALYRIEIAK